MGKTKDIREAVERELAFDPLVDSANIDILNLGGDVALNGTVPSYPQYLQAAAAAHRVAGVRRVDNHLEVFLPDNDYRDNAMLTTAANNALTLDVRVPPGVEAEAKDGNLTLSGVVDFGTQKAAAAEAVAGLVGVRNIRNTIEIDNTADPIDVLMTVQDALDRNSLVGDDSDVRVDTDDHSVTLTGGVRTWAERDAVVDAAWRARGVHEVRDKLTIIR